jgi:hypothetical protein
MCEGMSNVLDALAEILSIQVADISVGHDSWGELSHIQGNIEHLDVSTAHGDKLATFGPYAGEDQTANISGEIKVST